MKIEKVVTIPIKNGEIEWIVGAYHCTMKCGGVFVRNIHLWESADKIEEQPPAFFILNNIKKIN